MFSVSIAFETGALSLARRAKEPDPVHIYTYYTHKKKNINNNKSPNGQSRAYPRRMASWPQVGIYFIIPFAPYARLSQYNMTDIHWIFVCNLSSLYFKQSNDAKYQFALRLKRRWRQQQKKKPRCNDIILTKTGNSSKSVKMKIWRQPTGLRWGMRKMSHGMRY